MGVMKALGMRNGVAREALEAKILEAARTTAKELGDPSAETCVDPSSSLLHSLGNSMNLLIFGIEYDRLDPVWLQLQYLLEEGSKLIGIAGAINFLPWLRFLPYYRRTIKFIKENQIKSHEVYKELVDNFRASRVADDDTNGPRHFVDAYCKVIKSRGPGLEGSFTQRQLHHVAADLFGAGTDTALTTLRWLLLDMAANPHQQEAVYNEIADMAKGVGHVSTADMPALIQTQAALMETQRLHPVVPIGVPHGTTKDLEIGGFHVAKGTMLIPLLAEIHMDPKHYDDPEQYRPNRFIEETTGQLIRPASFMPFQAGRRVCPAEDFARMVLILYLSQIILLYRLKLPKEYLSTQNETKEEPGNTNTSPSEKKFPNVELQPDDPFADPICGFTATARPYKLIFAPRN